MSPSLLIFRGLTSDCLMSVHCFLNDSLKTDLC